MNLSVCLRWVLTLIYGNGIAKKKLKSLNGAFAFENMKLGCVVRRHIKAWFLSQDVSCSYMRGVERCTFAFTESKLINSLFVKRFERTTCWLSLEMKTTRISCSHVSWSLSIGDFNGDHQHMFIVSAIF